MPTQFIDDIFTGGETASGRLADFVAPLRKKALSADPPADDDADQDDTDLHTPDDSPEHELLLHAVTYARDCAHDGRDPQPVLDALHELGGGAEELRGVLDGGETVEKAVAWNKDLHPRSDDGRFISVDAIHRAKTNPKLAKQLRKRVTDPAEKKKLEAALSGSEIGHTVRSKQRADTAAKKEKVTADRDAARAIRDRLFQQHQLGQELHPDDLRALVPHLSTMSHAELSTLRTFLGGAGASFGGETRLAERRKRVLDWASQRGKEEGGGQKEEGESDPDAQLPPELERQKQEALKVARRNVNLHLTDTTDARHIAATGTPPAEPGAPVSRRGGLKVGDVANLAHETASGKGGTIYAGVSGGTIVSVGPKNVKVRVPAADDYLAEKYGPHTDYTVPLAHVSHVGRDGKVHPVIDEAGTPSAEPALAADNISGSSANSKGGATSREGANVSTATKPKGGALTADEGHAEFRAILADRALSIPDVRARFAALAALPKETLAAIAHRAGYTGIAKLSKPQMVKKLAKTLEGLKMDQHRYDRIVGAPLQGGGRKGEGGAEEGSGISALPLLPSAFVTPSALGKPSAFEEAGVDLPAAQADAVRAVRAHAAERTVGPPIDVLYAGLKEKHPNLTPGQFHDILRAAGKTDHLRVSGWSKTLGELPAGVPAMFHRHTVMYYAHPGATAGGDMAPPPVRDLTPIKAAAERAVVGGRSAHEDIHAELKRTFPDLTYGQFEDAMSDLRAEGRVTGEKWAKTIHELPHPETAHLVNRQVIAAAKPGPNAGSTPVAGGGWRLVKDGKYQITLARPDGTEETRAKRDVMRWGDDAAHPDRDGYASVFAQTELGKQLAAERAATGTGGSATNVAPYHHALARRHGATVSADGSRAVFPTADAHHAFQLAAIRAKPDGGQPTGAGRVVQASAEQVAAMRAAGLTARVVDHLAEHGGAGRTGAWAELPNWDAERWAELSLARRTS